MDHHQCRSCPTFDHESRSLFSFKEHFGPRVIVLQLYGCGYDVYSLYTLTLHHRHGMLKVYSIQMIDINRTTQEDRGSLRRFNSRGEENKLKGGYNLTCVTLIWGGNPYSHFKTQTRMSVRLHILLIFQQSGKKLFWLTKDTKMEKGNLWFMKGT